MEKNQLEEYTQKSLWPLLARYGSRSGPWKSILQEYAVKHYLGRPIYRTEKSGKYHAPVFTTTVEVNGKFYKGTSSNKKRDAEGKAACKAFTAIQAAEVAAPMEENKVEHKFPKVEIAESPDRSSKKRRISASKTSPTKDDTIITVENPVA